jgi:CheY-like chemotaxis protein
MRKRVLVIDDDPKLRELVAAGLELAGYEVRCAAGGAPGISLAESEPPDLILLDLHMPGLDGYEVCRTLRRRPSTRGIPVIMLTASADFSLNRKAYGAGAQACVPKPFRKEGLLATIRATLAGVPRDVPQS